MPRRSCRGPREDGCTRPPENNGQYVGAQYITFCERIWRPAFNNVTEQVCTLNSYAFGPHTDRTCVCYEAHVAQFSGYRHTIYGWAEA